jgi:hypothetical protein
MKYIVVIKEGIVFLYRYDSEYIFIKDEDCHWYRISKTDKQEFCELLDLAAKMNYSTFKDGDFDPESEFINKFSQCMVDHPDNFNHTYPMELKTFSDDKHNWMTKIGNIVDIPIELIHQTNTIPYIN